MTNRIRARSGILFTAVVLLAGSADAQQTGQRQLPQQTQPTGAEDSAQVTPAEEQARKLLEAMTSESTEGLVFEHRADGTIGLDLQGRFQHVLRAVPGKDGRLEFTCHTGGHAAAPAGAAIAPWNPRRGETLHRLDVKMLKAPIRVPSKKATPVAPEVK
jgi:hypothetical protein